jgi:hypothetical protein
MPCSNDEECILVNDSNIKVGNTECQCGFNGGGFTYCKLSEGDQEFRDIIKSFQFILLFGYECHTSLRFGPCHLIPQEEYITYKRATKRYEIYPKLVFNDPCIKNVYTSEYWDLKGYNYLYGKMFWALSLTLFAILISY